MQSNTILRSDLGSTEKLMGNNNNLNNNGSPGADIMFQMEDEGLTQLGSVFQSAYQSIVGGGPQVKDRGAALIHRSDYSCSTEGVEQEGDFPNLSSDIRDLSAGGTRITKINDLSFLMHIYLTREIGYLRSELDLGSIFIIITHLYSCENYICYRNELCSDSLASLMQETTVESIQI